MRFPFRKKETPAWVDSLNWTPEQPFGGEPRFVPGNDIGWTDDWRIEPKPAAPQPEPVAQIEPQAALVLIAAPTAPQREAKPKLQPIKRIEPPAAQASNIIPLTPEPAPPPPAIEAAVPVAPPAHANINRTPNFLLVRLGIGLAQGLLLFLLTKARAAGIWPGSDPYLFSALTLALLFAPTVALEGLGDIEIRALALWSGTIAALLGTIGLYQHWRLDGLPQLHADYPLIVLIAVMLAIAQCLLRAGLREGKMIVAYRVYFDTAWTLKARLLIWTLLTGIAFALIGSGNSLVNWLRAHHPGVQLSMAPTLLILPLLGLCSAAAFDMTAANSWSRGAMRAALLGCLTMALPILVFVSAGAIGGHLLRTPVPLVELLAMVVLLLAAMNASYRGEDRPRWRKACEFAAAFLVLALAILAGFALGARVSGFGWTAMRVYAAAAIAALGLYGMAYSGAALMSLGGARWMRPMEIINPILALALLAACAALASPLADPLPLAVQAQLARLAMTDPAAFDFAWLRRDGGRFGHDALQTLARNANPEIARDAALALVVPPGGDAPTPTGIGANITVRTPGARLPNTLLAQDWSKTPTAPPCLTRPGLSCDAWFLDLDGDGQREILLVYGNDARWWASVMKQNGLGAWAPTATLASPACRGSLSRMRDGGIALADPVSAWRDVLVAGLRLTPMPAARADLPCPN